VRATVVRYRTKPDRAEENQKLIEAVYAELAASTPQGFRYVTFRLDDGVSFVHVALEEDDAGNPLPDTEAFQAFTENIGQRCDEPPVAKSGTIVGAYRLFT
jgi:hypothetical protein